MKECEDAIGCGRGVVGVAGLEKRRREQQARLDGPLGRLRGPAQRPDGERRLAGLQQGRTVELVPLRFFRVLCEQLSEQMTELTESLW